MRPNTMSSNQHVNVRGVRQYAVGKNPNIRDLPSESDIGTAEAREMVAQLSKDLLPSNPISRSQFLNLPSGEREEKHVDLKTMLGLIIGAWALEKSMPIRSTNHKSSAADDYHSAREAMIEFGETTEPKDSDSDILRAAKMVSFTQTGRCGLHADRNFALIGSMLHRLDDECPGLRGYLPSVEKMVDETAGKRLGGPPDDDHRYVHIAGMTDPVVIDSWVLYPKVHLQSQGKYESGGAAASYQVTDEVHAPAASHQVRVNKHDIPKDFEGQLREFEQHKPKLRGNEEEMRGRTYWRDLTGRPLRGWQVVQSQREDAKETVYVCGDLKFDPDLMSTSGLQLRKTWAQEAKVALLAGGEQSPIRGLSPLPRPEPEALPPNTSESILGDPNPDLRV